MSAFGNRVFGEEINEKSLITAHAVNDQFGGVTVKMPLALHPIDAAVFGSALRSSISRWRQQVLISIFCRGSLTFYKGLTYNLACWGHADSNHA